MATSRTFAPKRIFTGLLGFLSVSAAYLFTFPQPNVFYAVVVLFHAVAGVVLTAWLLLWLWRLVREGSWLARLGWVLMLAGGLLGVVLIKIGTSRVEWNWLYLHIALCVGAVAFLVADRLGKREGMSSGVAPALLRGALCVAVLAGICAGSDRKSKPRAESERTNYSSDAESPA